MLYTEILTRKVELWIFSTRFTREKTPQNNFSSQNFSVENNYFFIPQHFFYVSRGCYNFEIFSFKLTCCGFHQKYRLSEYFSWIYYLNFTCC